MLHYEAKKKQGQTLFAAFKKMPDSIDLLSLTTLTSTFSPALEMLR